jgi:hypothetical protein
MPTDLVSASNTSRRAAPSALALAVICLLTCMTMLALCGVRVSATFGLNSHASEHASTPCCPELAQADAAPGDAPSHDCPPGCHDCSGCSHAGNVVPVSPVLLPALRGSRPVGPSPITRLTTPEESPTSRIFHPPRSAVQA